MGNPLDPTDEPVHLGEDLAEQRAGQRAAIAGTAEAHGRVWRVLVVGDDTDVHASTRLALANATILDRPVDLIHARTAAEARAILSLDSEFAVILLHMALDRGGAGLALVKVVRDELGLHDVRILPAAGHAAEAGVLGDYDVGEACDGAACTRAGLIDAISAAVTAFDQLRLASASRRGLDLLARANTELMGQHGLQAFASGVLGQLAGLLGIPAEGVVCVQEAPGGGSADQLVVAAAGRYTHLIGHSLTALPERRVVRAVLRCQQEQHILIGEDHVVLFFAGKAARNMAAWLGIPRPLDELDQRLLDVFCGNIAVGMDNVSLFSRLHDFAYYDQLLGLPNRTRFVSIVTEAIQQRSAERGVLALVDIDHFADTNDALGHQFGDQLLKAVAVRLHDGLEDCSVARISGDTFGILGPDRRVKPDTLHELFATPFTIGESELMVSVTAGIVRLDDSGTATGSDALKHASIALKRGKTRQRGSAFYFTREMGEAIRERVVLLNELRHAFKRSQLGLYYQPQVDLESGATVGLEALMRWNVGDGVFVPPQRFIPLAERSGLIVAMGEWALRTACVQLAKLQAAGHRGLRMAVNVSQVQLRHPLFLRVLGEALSDSGIDPACLDLEITESMAMEEPAFILDTLLAVKTLGVQISVDDFGTGFSSLSHLQRLHVDRLKIDRSFVTEITQSSRGGRIAEMVVQLGHHLDLEVIAEGVETREQAEFLRELGCQEAQGFHFGVPMPEHELPPWLARHAKP